MKKLLVSVIKKAGLKTAVVPIEVRSWPTMYHQPKMPTALRELMKMNSNRQK